MGTPKKSMQHKGKTGRAAFEDASGSALHRSLVQEHHLLGGSAAGSSPEPGSEHRVLQHRPETVAFVILLFKREFLADGEYLKNMYCSVDLTRELKILVDILFKNTHFIHWIIGLRQKTPKLFSQLPSIYSMTSKSLICASVYCVQ